MLVPPASFGIAEEGIYRCSRIETLNLSFLETLDLRTVLYIGGQEPSNFMEEFFTRNSIEWFVLNSPAYVDVVPSINSNGKDQSTTAVTKVSSDESESCGGGGVSSTASNYDKRTALPTKRSNIVQNATTNENKVSSLSSGGIDIIDSSVPHVGGINGNSNNNGCGSSSSSNNKNKSNNTPQSFNSTKTTNTNGEIGPKTKSKSKVRIKYTLSDSDGLMLIKSECIKKVFYKLLNKDNYNLLLVDRTGLIIGMLRKIQKWNISSIINEYRLYAGKNRSYFSETFLELISIRLTQESSSSSSSSTGKGCSKSNETPKNMQQFQRSLQGKKIPRSRRSNGEDEEGEKKGDDPGSENYMVAPIVFVNEEDLCKPIEVPERLIRIIEEVEQRDRAESLANEDNMSTSSESHRGGSNLGIFGHRYRLAFNKKENGLYEYYKPGIKPNKGNEDQNAVEIKIPVEPDLPEWFKWQRDMWEQENSPEEHHFYRESIFI